jgi:DNA invertase Pin-like site-specific DNA recombinase
MRIGIYARVSTRDQSCELQIRDLRSYCAARRFELVREYVDVGQSGAKDSRPELNNLMDDARRRQFDAIVVWRFDRFARSTKHLLTALEEFRGLGIQFISYRGRDIRAAAVPLLLQAVFPIGRRLCWWPSLFQMSRSSRKSPYVVQVPVADVRRTVLKLHPVPLAAP